MYGRMYVYTGGMNIQAYLTGAYALRVDIHMYGRMYVYTGGMNIQAYLTGAYANTKRPKIL